MPMPFYLQQIPMNSDSRWKPQLNQANPLGQATQKGSTLTSSFKRHVVSKEMPPMRRRAACGGSTSRCSHRKNDCLTVKHVGFTMVLPLKVGFTYVYIYIIYTTCASQFSIWSYPYEWCQYFRTYWFVYILFPTKMLVLPRWAWFRNLCHSTGWSIGIPIMDDDNPQHIGYYNPQVDVWYFLDIVCNYIPSYPKSSCSNIGFDKQKGLYP